MTASTCQKSLPPTTTRAQRALGVSLIALLGGVMLSAVNWSETSSGVAVAANFQIRRSIVKEVVPPVAAATRSGESGFPVEETSRSTRPASFSAVVAGVAVGKLVTAEMEQATHEPSALLPAEAGTERFMDDNSTSATDSGSFSGEDIPVTELPTYPPDTTSPTSLDTAEVIPNENMSDMEQAADETARPRSAAASEANLNLPAPESIATAPLEASLPGTAGSSPVIAPQQSAAASIAWRLLTQCAINDPQAAQVLLAQARSTTIPAEAWPEIATTLVGETLSEGALVTLVPVAALENHRLDLLEALLATNPGAAARQALQRAATAWLEQISRKHT